jgi:hypothetical protein
MKYDKPELVVLGSAVEDVQSANANKLLNNVTDSSSIHATSTAYEADE